jgi:hypothetical protein
MSVFCLLTTTVFPWPTIAGGHPREVPGPSTDADGEKAVETVPPGQVNPAGASQVVGDASSPSTNWSNQLTVGLGVPATGSITVLYGKPITERLSVQFYLSYFRREWMLTLPDQGKWRSRSFYWGLTFQYYPFDTATSHTWFYVGADVGMAASRQTYRPLNKSQTVFFPFIDINFLGLIIPVWRGLVVDISLGGGYAPVSHETNIDGHVNEGDFYPLGDVRLGYRW